MYEKRICETCGKKFTPKAHNQKYCVWFTCAPGQLSGLLRYKIFERDEFQCFYCGQTSFLDKKELHLDHVIPISLGGSDVADNVVTACKECNFSKGASKIKKKLICLMNGEIKRRNLIARINNKMEMKNNRYE